MSLSFSVSYLCQRLFIYPFAYLHTNTYLLLKDSEFQRGCEPATSHLLYHIRQLFKDNGSISNSHICRGDGSSYVSQWTMDGSCCSLAHYQLCNACYVPVITSSVIIDYVTCHAIVSRHSPVQARLILKDQVVQARIRTCGL